MADALSRINHIVVLMMENRSFDHMLGYLKADGVIPEVDGLDPSQHGNPWPDGTFEPVRPMAGRFLHHKVQDPGHGRDDVKEQLDDGNQGFLRNYVKVLERNKRRLRDRDQPVPPDDELPANVVLGYQQAEDVPVYDYIARNFRVLDRWFSSVPDATWPNRMYAMTGGSGEKADLELPGWLADKVKDAPIYDRPAFVRWLREDDWRWYSHDPATLRAADSAYRPGGEPNRASDANFAYFNRRTLFERRTFLDDAEDGRLPAVSWIDPNFVDLRPLGPPGSNDDHPPSRVILGQELVLTVLLALADSPCWKDTLLLITYDEHGGFYDHVKPADYPCPGEEGRPYGVRVPALAVSALLDPGVTNTVFDHTSIPKTILTRFADARSQGDAFAALGERTRSANHLGDLITREDPRDPPLAELGALARRFRDWKAELYRGTYVEESTIAERAFEAVTDLQAEIISQAAQLRSPELPPGKP